MMPMGFIPEVLCII